MRNAGVKRGKVLQLVLIRGCGDARGEVVSNLREMQEEGHGVDKEDAIDPIRDWGAQQVCRHDGAIGVRDENEFPDGVVFEDLLNLCAGVLSG